MFVKTDDLTFHVDLQGPDGAPTLVLLHSLGTSLHLWDPQLAALKRRYRLLRLDMRGHGLSEAGSSPFSLDDLAHDVLKITGKLGIGDFSVAGVSIGGMIAQRLADLAPDRLLSMILVDTSLITASPQAWIERAREVRERGLDHMVEGIVSRWVTPAFLDTVEADGLRQMLRRTSIEGFAGCAEALAGADLRQPENTRVPTLVLVGDTDVSTPLAACRELAEARRGRLIQLSSAAHIPNFEQPRVLAAAMEDFLVEYMPAPQVAA
ncbi:3-oxoadipate enol-lactonase [Breoghania corrubedonensis]|uniref:3-oxoadipate enol-lactonase n=1 Tax=Breoghania corrubedonensis TaxID=665038 RepID=A0A2T5VE87_9HYPH|nr:alpha/beta fold hydrolase [Breoghania corrubedonensis]PTW62026.1 3-oxoadipate enol-lactonase [Breoghania corrubedonensis]